MQSFDALAWLPIPSLLVGADSQASVATYSTQNTKSSLLSNACFCLYPSTKNGNNITINESNSNSKDFLSGTEGTSVGFGSGYSVQHFTPCSVRVMDDTIVIAFKGTESNSKVTGEPICFFFPLSLINSVDVTQNGDIAVIMKSGFNGDTLINSTGLILREYPKSELKSSFVELKNKLREIVSQTNSNFSAIKLCNVSIVDSASEKIIYSNKDGLSIEDTMLHPIPVSITNINPNDTEICIVFNFVIYGRVSGANGSGCEVEFVSLPCKLASILQEQKQFQESNENNNFIISEKNDHLRVALRVFDLRIASTISLTSTLAQQPSKVLSVPGKRNIFNFDAQSFTLASLVTNFILMITVLICSQHFLFGTGIAYNDIYSSGASLLVAIVLTQSVVALLSSLGVAAVNSKVTSSPIEGKRISMSLKLKEIELVKKAQIKMISPLTSNRSMSTSSMGLGDRIREKLESEVSHSSKSVSSDMNAIQPPRITDDVHLAPKKGEYKIEEIQDLEGLVEAIDISYLNTNKINSEEDLPYNWLLGMKFDRKEALKRWRESLQWRLDNHVDDILSVNPFMLSIPSQDPQIDVQKFLKLKELWPQHFLCQDRHGNLVTLERFHHLDQICKDMKANNITPEDFASYVVFLNEFWIKHKFCKTGKLIKIMDVSGLTVGFNLPIILKYFGRMNAELQKYPEILGESYFVNVEKAGAPFRILFKLLPRFLEPRTMEKIHQVKLDNGHSAEIRSLLDPKWLPKDLGGDFEGDTIEDLPLEKQVADFVKNLLLSSKGQ